MATLGSNEYFLVNTEFEDRRIPNSKEFCCLIDRNGDFKYDVEYTTNKELDDLLENMFDGVIDNVIVTVVDNKIIAWRAEW
jgi:hypothetical protein